jgi:unsaturated rhamnogalacturonyl hydrolase
MNLERLKIGTDKKKPILLFFIILLASVMPLTGQLLAAGKKLPGNEAAGQTRILTLMEQVADWQIANYGKLKHHDLSWTNAVFYTGLTELTRLSSGSAYRQWLLNMGWKYQWQPYFRMYMADDLAVAQMYLDIYRQEGDKRMLEPTYARTEWVIGHPSVSNLLYEKGKYLTMERWSWCDALFMAPPVYARMYSITKDPKFLDFMDREYKLSYDLLYDREEKLFYRDHHFFGIREKNGEKVFWGRGNGWVLGGLVKILKELPQTSQSRIFYAKLFVEMCERVSTLQDKEGYWHASMLDPESYPYPETSVSGFFVYALAYGINSGLLEKEKYLPIVEKGWKALENAVFPDGKLGWVQPVGSSPKETTKEMTEIYGVGAFLLAGCEMYRLLGDQH